MTKPLTASRATGALAKATVAAGLAVGLLAGGGGTLANWYEGVTVLDRATVSAGSVSLTDQGTTTMLLSQQPVGSRTYASSTTCAVPSGYTECRVVSTTLAAERIIPGDALVMTQKAAFTTNGTNLKGVLTVDTRGAVDGTASPYAAAATITTKVQAPGDSTATTTTNATRQVTVNRATGAGIGTYTITTTVSTPTTKAGAPWGTEGWSSSFPLKGATLTFQQR